MKNGALDLTPPTDADFLDEHDEETDFLEAPALKTLAADLIDGETRFSSLVNVPIAYLWKKKGGAAGGQPIPANVQKASGLVAYFSSAHAIVWCAADHFRDYNFTPEQIEAELYNQLCRLDRDDKGRVAVHDYSLIVNVTAVKKYGTWRADLRRAKEVLQGQLFGNGPLTVKPKAEEAEAEA